jgi:membrane fusion protein, multidrug efflux system
MTGRHPRSPMRGRTKVVLACALTGVLVVGAGTVVVVANATAAAAEQPAPAPTGGTAVIEKGDLQGVSRSAGTLAYADPADLQSGLGGVVTWLPDAGGSIGQGQPLYAVNDERVYLLHGSLPAWRAFAAGMPDGPDVAQLETALAALGYFSGTPDEHFDLRTRLAILAWQKATGQERTGGIPLGVIVFQPTDVRVAQVATVVGAQVGPGTPVLKMSSLTKQVDVQLRLADQKLAVNGGAVTVQLPDGRTAGGTIQSVGVPTPQDPSDPASATIIPVVITLDDGAAADGFQQASVVVTFPTETRKDVLSVPLTALIALPGGSFGVQVVDSNGKVRSVPVKTGLFAGDRVEVSGEIDAGQKVLVPST